MAGPLTRAARRILAVVDAQVNRLYTWRYNPLYQSGALVVVALATMLLTGLYLLLFYRIGGPYPSVERISTQIWAGRWMRALHRYAADLAVLAAVAHAVRLFLQGRSWGPRVLAWTSGVLLVGLLYLCGWTGYVMVWDPQAQLLATEGARLLDALPLFSEPLVRVFVGEQPIPGAFFFLNLFAHIAIPVGMAGMLWLHVSRVSRPVLLPPRRLWLTVVGVLLVLAVVWPAPLEGPANPFQRPESLSLDLLYGFWVPIQLRLGPWSGWLLLVGLPLGVLLVPLASRPRASAALPASVVEERFCTGCEQCFVDCPFEAISMVERGDGRATLVARVDPARCVSCGICAGSCAPMGVGPPGRDGRDQLVDARAFLARRGPDERGPVVIGCANSGAGGPRSPAGDRLLVSCLGNLHTSIIEILVRSGVPGVLIVSCPPRDCWSREGPGWLDQRIYHDREAELKARVDRRRVRVVYASAAEGSRVARARAAFESDLADLARPVTEEAVELDQSCEPPVTSGEPR
ncbi:MAG: cytochrome b N-terminal domain-containing protein [Gemmatimonadota bacterium]